MTQCETLIHFNVDKVKKTTNDAKESIDIINFYNSIYLAAMRTHFKLSAKQ